MMLWSIRISMIMVIVVIVSRGCMFVFRKVMLMFILISSSEYCVNCVYSCVIEFDMLGVCLVSLSMFFLVSWDSS